MVPISLSYQAEILRRTTPPFRGCSITQVLRLSRKKSKESARRAVGTRWQIPAHSRFLSFRPEAQGRREEGWAPQTRRPRPGNPSQTHNTDYGKFLRGTDSVILRRSRRIWPPDETFLPFVTQIVGPPNAIIRVWGTPSRRCASFRACPERSRRDDTRGARIFHNPYNFAFGVPDTQRSGVPRRAIWPRREDTPNS